MGHKKCTSFLILFLWIITISNATYTSEERSDNTKSLYSATHSVLGSTENNHQYRKHIYDNPPAYGYFNAPHSAYHVDGSERYYNGIASSGGMSGGIGETAPSGRAYVYGPVPNAISSSGGFVGTGSNLASVPCSQRNCGSGSYYNNIASIGAISGGNLAAGNGNRVPYDNGPLPNGGLAGIVCPSTDAACTLSNRQNSVGKRVRSETEEIDYPKPPPGTFDPTVSGAGNTDVHSDLRSPSTRYGSITSGFPTNSNSYALPTAAYASPIAGNTGHPPYFSYLTQPRYVGGGGYDSSVQPGGGPTFYYPPPPSSQGAYMHQQPPHSLAPHENANIGNPGGYNTLDHAFKTNSEYNENGHHVGYFQAPNDGYGYNGAFNRPIFKK